MGGGEIYQASERVEQMTGRWSWARRPADQLVRRCGDAALSLRWAANPLHHFQSQAVTPSSHVSGS